MLGISWVAAQLAASQEGLSSMSEWVSEWQVMKLLIMQVPPTSRLFRPNILLNTLFSNILSPCSSLNVRDQVSHAYIPKGKIIVPYILRTEDETTWDSEFTGSKSQDKEEVAKKLTPWSRIIIQNQNSPQLANSHFYGTARSFPC
jgi:hypothetical protein